MADPKSRYSGVGRAVRVAPDGSQFTYLRTVILPQPTSLAVAGTVTVVSRDRPDLVATRTLGDPLQAWRIANINAAMNPADMTTQPGRVLVIPAP